MNRSFQEDRELLSRCLAGNRMASETLVRQFSDLVYRSVQYTLMTRHVPFSRHDLEDLHNTVFLRLFEQGCRKLGQYEGKNGCTLASWIRMIAVRTVLDHLRKKGVDAIGRQKKRIPLEELPELRSDEVEVGAQIEKVEQGRLLQEAMQRLLPRDRMFMKLHFNHGLSVAEIAETMRLSISNAHTLKHRAIQRLRLHIAYITNNRP
ncbi:MAG: sigma-70 family RNA polymerase sigma factor [Thermodesulfobacteriota bacterium]|nr:sigma-70 family RNA polymerase sigma factor [Thermodesulfobacteriota bacterium]